jgi:hypothetical protein
MPHPSPTTGTLRRFSRRAHHKSPQWSSALADCNFVAERSPAVFGYVARRHDDEMTRQPFRASRAVLLSQAETIGAIPDLRFLQLCFCAPHPALPEPEPSAETIALGKLLTTTADCAAAIWSRAPRIAALAARPRTFSVRISVGKRLPVVRRRLFRAAPGQRRANRTEILECGGHRRIYCPRPQQRQEPCRRPDG